MKFSVSPVVRVAVEPKIASDLPKLVEGAAVCAVCVCVCCVLMCVDVCVLMCVCACAHMCFCMPIATRFERAAAEAPAPCCVVRGIACSALPTT